MLRPVCYVFFFGYVNSFLSRSFMKKEILIFSFIILSRLPMWKLEVPHSMDRSSRHLLRLVISCRKLSAEVSAPQTQAIVAMAATTEPEFALRQRALLSRNPSAKLLWNSATAARVGEILAQRLRAIGVDGVSVDLDQELARPPHWRRSVSPFFEAVQRSGVRIEDADKLQWP